VRFADVAHFRPGGFSRAALTQGERPMTFTLVLSTGARLPFEMKAELPDAAQSDWTRALLFFIGRPELDWGLYEGIEL
jgi:hypothetical protein